MKSHRDTWLIEKADDLNVQEGDDEDNQNKALDMLVGRGENHNMMSEFFNKNNG